MDPAAPPPPPDIPPTAESDSPPAAPEAAAAAANAYSVQLTYSDGIWGWLEAKRKQLPVYGSSGSLLVTSEGVVLQGWGRNWLGIPQRAEVRIAPSEIRHASADGPQVRFEFRRGRRQPRTARFRAESSAQAEALVAQLRAMRSDAVDPVWAEWHEFNQRLDAASPRVVVTYTLVALNVAAYVVTAVSGRNAMFIPIETLTSWGSNLGLLTLHGEWWRLLTALFLHGNLLHLLINMWVLWGAGRLVERLYGSLSFLVLYLLSGVLGVGASLAWNPAINAVGASGAIFGILGGYLAFLRRRHTRVPRSVAKSLAWGIIPFILYTIVTGIAQSGIDNAAHIGGLLSGFALGWLLARPLDAATRSSLPLIRVGTAVGLSAVAVLAAFIALGAFKPANSAPERYWLQHKQYVAEETEAFRVLQDMSARWGAGQVSRADAAKAIRSQVLPFWKRWDERLAKEPRSSEAAYRDFAAAVAEFVHIRSEWCAAFLESLERGDYSEAKTVAALLKNAELARARIGRLEMRGQAANRPPSLSRSQPVIRLRRLLQRNPECVGKDAYLAAKEAHPPDPADGPTLRAQIGCEVQRAFAQGDVTSLERLFRGYTAHLGDLPDGESSLRGFNQGLDSYFDGTASIEEAMATLADWRRQFPESVAPSLFEAALFRNWAWSARGEGYANSVTNEGWAAYAFRTEMAAASLREIEPRAAQSPIWYSLSIVVALDRSIPAEQIRAIFDRGVARYPDYLPLYTAMLRTLTPRWGGSIEGIDRFINDVHGRTQERLGFEMYARLYWMLAAMEGDDTDLFTDTLAEWSIMKRGFHDMLKNHPHSTLLQNAFARFACQAHDWEEYRPVRTQFGTHLWKDAWSTEFFVESCDKREKAAAEAAARHAAENVTAN